MQKTHIQKILKYYLEYEIYNVANSSKIEIDNKRCFIINNILNVEEVYQSIKQLKTIKISQQIEHLIGKNVKNKQEL